ncbi:hypothetical protein [Clostridium bornimense]|uniref:hypothetical protein n=1 Tax=Clostridium bornimense TaxID=1216932 RepID=UPI0020A05A8C
MNVSDFWNYENISIEEYQELIYILENKSEHPIGIIVIKRKGVVAQKSKIKVR